VGMRKKLAQVMSQIVSLTLYNSSSFQVLMGGNEEEISPSDESNSVSHFVQFIFFLGSHGWE
jgi:hypothetical protein